MINVVGAILFKDNKIILARRAKTLKNFPDLFEFPGGKVEKNETSKKALTRELEEELKIKVNEVEEFKNNTHKNTIEKSGKIINLKLFIVRNWIGNIKINEKIHSELAYVDIKNLHNFEGFIPGDSVFIPTIQKILIEL